MSNEIVPASGNSLASKIQYAQAMAGSSLLPKQYQRQPANLLFALEYAEALGVSPIHAITSIHVIEGKPSASADLIAALVRKAGHKLRITGDDTHARAVLIRQDDPDFEFVAEWTIKKAQAANLTGKAVWKNYPGAMLRSRAITEVARMGAPDALYGVIYTAEELGAEVNGSGDPVEPFVSAPHHAPDPADGDVLDEEPAPPTDAAAEQVNQRRTAAQHEQPVPQPDWSAMFEAAKDDKEHLTALRNQGKQAGLPNTYGMFAAIEAALQQLAAETPVEGTLVDAS